MRLSDLLRKASTTFTLADRLFRLREWLAAKSGVGRRVTRRPTRLGFEPMEERIVPDGPDIPYPSVIDYEVNNNAKGALVTLIGWNGQYKQKRTGANGHALVDGVQPAWQGVSGTAGWTIDVILPNGYAYYQNNRDFAMKDPYEVVDQNGITVHNAITFTDIVTGPLIAPNAAGCPVGPTLFPQSATGNQVVPTAASPIGAGGVRYSDGVTMVAESDLVSAGFGSPWGHTRSWSNPVRYPYSYTQAALLWPDGGARIVWVDTPDTRGFAYKHQNGPGWVDHMHPRLRFDPWGRSFIMTGTADRSMTFYKYNDTTYVPAMSDRLTAAARTGEIIVTDGQGNRSVFHDDYVAQPERRGQLKRYVPVNGVAAEVTAYTPDGDPAEIRRGQGSAAESWVYTYNENGSLTGVTHRRSVDSGTTWTPVQAVEYRYTDWNGRGSPGLTLKAALVHDGDLSGPVIETKYYRYYAHNEGNGVYQGMKFAVSSQAFERMAAAYGVTISSVDNLSDAQVAVYADRAFEYHPDGRVKKVVAQGEGCSVCTAGQGTYQYGYTLNPQYGAGAEPNDWAEMNRWRIRTTETLPDGNQNIVYTNQLGQVMLKVYRDTATGQEWRTYTHYDAFGRVEFTADAAAVTGYSEQYTNLVHQVGWSNGNYEFLSDTQGRITWYTYGTSTTAGWSTGGDVQGFLKSVSLWHGDKDPTPDLIEGWRYISRTATVDEIQATIYPLVDHRVYTREDITDVNAIFDYRRDITSYTWSTGAAALHARIVSHAAAEVWENGSGFADVTEVASDTLGRPVWVKDADGYLHYTAYDPATGAKVKEITDVDTSRTGEFADLPAGWATPAGGGLHLVSLSAFDKYGRLTKATYPNGRIDYVTYNDTTQETRFYRGWTGTTTTGPVEVVRRDRRGGLVTVGGSQRVYTYAEHLTMVPAVIAVDAQGRPTGTEPIANIQSLTRDYYTAADQLVWHDEYFDLAGLAYYGGDGRPAFTLGAVNVNYYRTEYTYDNRGRQNRVIAPTGTITRTDYNGLGLETAIWVGTVDGPTGNMVQTAAYEYDGGGVGNGNLTRVTLKPGTGLADRVTQIWYDWRDQPVAEKVGVSTVETDGVHRPITVRAYGNLGEEILTEVYDGDGVTPVVTNGVLVALPANRLRSREATGYDAYGRVYRIDQFAVDAATGAVATSRFLRTSRWYDRRGHLVKEVAPGAPVVKWQYDGAGRLVKEFATDGGMDAVWADALNVDSDAVLTQIEYAYDGGGNVLWVTTRDRFHDATGTGGLATPASTTAPKGRVSYQAYYYDAADRLTAAAEFGTNGGAALTRPAVVPGRSDIVLVTTYEYDAAGRRAVVTDPRGVVGRTYYDPLGRVTKSVENYVDGVASNTDDKTILYTYDGSGHTRTVTLILPGGGQQVTEFVYGVTVVGGSKVDSNDLLAEVRYPDPVTGAASAVIREQYRYNALGQMTQFIARNLTGHGYAFDVVGRLVADTVIALPTGVDGTVLRIETAYDGQGNPYLVTGYDAYAGGAIVSQVRREYNAFGQLAREYQATAGAVDTTTTPSVRYTHSGDSTDNYNHSRLTALTYPDGRAVYYRYLAGLDDAASRVTDVYDADRTLETYSYVGLDTVVSRSRQQTGLVLTYIKPAGDPDGEAGDQYAGLDRFGRVVDHRWVRADGTHVDRFRYGYDRAGNRTSRDNPVNPTAGEQYTYDSLGQLTSFRRGTLTRDAGGAVTGVTGVTRSQDWTLDAAGNMAAVTSDGVAQTRVHDRQNQATGIGTAALTYDANGSLTADETGRQLKWDAWGRLVEVRDAGGAVLATFRYDGEGRRVRQTVGGTTTDLYYSAAGQVLEEYVGGVAVARYVWTPGYVDALLMRDRDADGQSANGLEERLYVTQDANWNVTALTDAAGAVVERYWYDPFGRTTVLDMAFSLRAGTQYGWVYRHQGLRWVEQVGMFDNRARWYSPTLMRFVSNDPIGFAAGDVNTYRYEGNSPAGNVDPSGLFVPAAAAAAARAAAAGVAAGVAAVLLNGAFNRAGGYDFWCNWDKAFVNGFVAGFTAALIPTRAVGYYGSAFVAGAAGAGAESAYSQYMQTGHINPRRVVEDALWGGATSVAFAGFLRGAGAVAGRTVSAAVHGGLGRFPKTHAAATALAQRLGFQVCFAAGTPLRTPGGSRAIEDIRPGDFVLSRDEHDPAGAVGPRVVEEVFVREGLVWHLHVGGRVIRTTAEHPFYAHGRGWVACHDLAAGDWLLTEEGRWAAVEDVLDTGAWETVYNLRVADHHTYFVGQESWEFSLWVHNRCGAENAALAARLAAHLRFQAATGFTRLSPTRVLFRGLEVRGVRSLGHLTERQLRYGMEHGVAPRAPGRGDSLYLHHHRQQVQGPVLEIPQRIHTQNYGNPRLHPLGNTGGIGNGPERQAFNTWREAYWKLRYQEELLFRGLL